MARLNVFVIPIALSALSGCQNAPAPQPAEVIDPIPTLTPAVIIRATKILNAEPQIVDVLYDPSAIVQWTAAVKGDGSRRDGYAQYLCQQISAAGARLPRTVVRVVDVHTVTFGNGDLAAASLGSASCDTGHPFDTR